MDNNVEKKQIENSKREKLKREKPFVYDKILKLNEKFSRGESIAIIDIAYDYICNLKCNHCLNSKFPKKERALAIEDLKKLSEQADQLGLCQFNISGGEPLLFKEIDEIILALNPEKFHLSMSTNGHFLDYERASHLKSIGLDKVKISLDSIDEDYHNRNRNNKGAYKKAMEAIAAAKEAGLDVIIQHVVSHQTAQSENTVKLAKFAQDNNFTLDMLIARALGEWEGKHEVLITQEDADFLYELHKKYPCARRDVFPSYGMDRGCGTVNCTLHITKYGDVLPCVYIQIAIGNILEESLADIIARGFSIKHFREYRQKCLSGEDRGFIDKYMAKCYGKPLPVPYSEVFSKDDFCE
jgi:MoaA/NifB/PqqE/SkfB family radical SAM enzyme